MKQIVKFCLLSFLFPSSLALNYLVELWSTEHLLDLLQSDAERAFSPAIRPAVIALNPGNQERDCSDVLTRMRYSSDRINKDIQNMMANSDELLFGYFDLKQAKQPVWYNWDDQIMNVFNYYNLTNQNECYILYQSQDWSNITANGPDTYEIHPSGNIFQSSGYEMYTGEMNEHAFVAWIWDRISVELSIENVETSESKISVYLQTKYPHISGIISSDDDMISVEVGSDGESQPNQKRAISTIDGKLLKSALGIGQSWNSFDVEKGQIHIGDVITIIDDSTNQVIGRLIVSQKNGRLMQVSIDTTKKQTDPKITDLKRFNKKRKKKLDLSMQRDWSTRRRYLNNIRSPPVMPGFTELGYKKQRMPKEICDYLTAFYNERKNKQNAESFPEDATQINVRERQTFMMHIPGDKKRWIGNVLRPMMEKWSNTSLVYSTIYGLREYRNGATLKGHVDRVETHIISAILHIHHEPSDVPWPLEVTDFDGNRIYIADEVCEMTFYESSKLIHGRPSSYNGTAWVNAFLHYRPDYWDDQGWSFTPDNVIVTPETRVPLVDFVYG